MPVPTSTVPANTAANQLPELPAGPSLEFVRGPIEIPLFETWQLICISLLSAVLVSILANWLIRFLRTRTKCPSSLPPEEIARRAIGQANGDDRAYTQALTHALRSYLTTPLQGPILSQTSTETLRNLPADFPINDSELKSFLEQCDIVKFANKSLTPEQRNELADTALKFVETVHQSYKEAAAQ